MKHPPGWQLRNQGSFNSSRICSNAAPGSLAGFVGWTPQFKIGMRSRHDLASSSRLPRCPELATLIRLLKSSYSPSKNCLVSSYRRNWSSNPSRSWRIHPFSAHACTSGSPSTSNLAILNRPIVSQWSAGGVVLRSQHLLAVAYSGFTGPIRAVSEAALALPFRSPLGAAYFLLSVFVPTD